METHLLCVWKTVSGKVEWSREDPPQTWAAPWIHTPAEQDGERDPSTSILPLLLPHCRYRVTLCLRLLPPGGRVPSNCEPKYLTPFLKLPAVSYFVLVTRMITNEIWLHHFVACSQSNTAWIVACGSAGVNTHPLACLY